MRRIIYLDLLQVWPLLLIRTDLRKRNAEIASVLYVCSFTRCDEGLIKSAVNTFATIKNQKSKMHFCLEWGLQVWFNRNHTHFSYST